MAGCTGNRSRNSSYYGSEIGMSGNKEKGDAAIDLIFLADGKRIQQCL
jgi:hypothetical protein